ncbi:MAG: hypothetical protein IJ389_05475 [Clostridia bacterium]|nr:hypothetical protein [Clostridia bacterium]
MAIACELCGGKLVMQAGGIATCDVCGLEYSLERMRELLALTNPQIIIKTETESSYVEQTENLSSFDTQDNTVFPENRTEAEHSGTVNICEDGSHEEKESPSADDDDIFDFFSAPSTPAQEPEETINKTEDAMHFVHLAQTNIEVGVYSAALEMCDKAIDIDPRCYEAFKEKALAMCNIYPQNDIQLYQIANFFSAAVELAPDDMRDAVRTTAERELMAVIERSFAETSAEFIRWPDEPLKTALTEAISAARSYTEDIDLISALLFNASLSVINTVETAWNEKIRADFNKTDKHPNLVKARKFLSRIELCHDVISTLITVHPSNKEILKPVYKLLIKFQKAKLGCTYWTYEGTDSLGGKNWKENHPLSDSQKLVVKENIDSLKRDLELLDPSERPLTKEERQRIKKERYEAYWTEHAKEREELLEEQELMRTQITELKRSINRLPAYKEEADLTSLIRRLIEERNRIVGFKNVERSAIQAQIDDAEAKLQRVKEALRSINDGIARKIEEIEADINNIDYELTRER